MEAWLGEALLKVNSGFSCPGVYSLDSISQTGNQAPERPCDFPECPWLWALCHDGAGPPSAVLAFQAPTGQIPVIPPTALSPPSRQCSGALGLPKEPLLLPSWRVRQSGSWEPSSLILRLPGRVSRCFPVGSPDSVPGRDCVCPPDLWTPSQCPSGLASPTFLLASGLGLW